jgi:hypothetical protein
MSFILLGILNSQVEAEAAGAYELISTQVLSSSASTVTFSSIPQDYKHLQIRMVTRSTRSNNIAGFGIRFNSDSGTNYDLHSLSGDGSSVTSFASNNLSFVSLSQTAATSTASSFGATVSDILDYTNTSKNKTVRSLLGYATTTNLIALRSGLWRNTAAISAMEIYDTTSNNFLTGSRFSLYGIKG